MLEKIGWSILDLDLDMCLAKNRMCIVDSSEGGRNGGLVGWYRYARKQNTIKGRIIAHSVEILWGISVGKMCIGIGWAFGFVRR